MPITNVQMSYTWYSLEEVRMMLITTCVWMLWAYVSSHQWRLEYQQLQQMKKHMAKLQHEKGSLSMGIRALRKKDMYYMLPYLNRSSTSKMTTPNIGLSKHQLVRVLSCSEEECNFLRQKISTVFLQNTSIGYPKPQLWYICKTIQMR